MNFECTWLKNRLSPPPPADTSHRIVWLTCLFQSRLFGWRLEDCNEQSTMRTSRPSNHAANHSTVYSSTLRHLCRKCFSSWEEGWTGSFLFAHETQPWSNERLTLGGMGWTFASWLKPVQNLRMFERNWDSSGGIPDVMVDRWVENDCQRIPKTIVWACTETGNLDMLGDEGSSPFDEMPEIGFMVECFD